MKIDHSVVIIAVLVGFTIFMIYKVVTQPAETLNSPLVYDKATVLPKSL